VATRAVKSVATLWARIFGRPFTYAALARGISFWLATAAWNHVWHGWSWPAALTSCFVSGLLFLILTERIWRSRGI
jgi:hypothetical protein